MRFMEECNPREAAGKRGPGSKISSWRVGLILAASLGIMTAGCGSNSSSGGGATPPPSLSPSQQYFAPSMESQSLATYMIDHAASTDYPEGTFVRTTYSASGATIADSGGIDLPGAKPSNGVLGLATTYVNGSTSISQALAGSWAVELPGEAALVQINTPALSGVGTTIPAVNYFTPAVPTQSCPSLTSSETFQFVTIPNSLSTSNAITQNSWTPELETAYGSVEIATTGTSVTFSNVTQNTLPSANGGKPGKPQYPGSGSATSSCSQTSFGQTISIPNAATVTNPGIGQTVAPAATIGIGPSGFLVEDAGSGAADAKTGLTYENILGAGYGAIGLPQPSSDLTSSLVGAQYQGFLYAPGSSSTGFTLIGSFGYSNLQTSCPSLPAPRTSTILYGGEFAGNDPSKNTFGNCDLAVDLGKQSQNGLYPAATVYVASGFPQNGTKPLQAYSFAAVAVAGQIKGKNAIFLIGADTAGTPNRAWGIYLLQSN